MSAPHAVVIGGSRGLGRVVTQTLIDRGDRVTVISRRRDRNIEGALHYAFDLEHLTSASADQLAAQVAAACGPVNYLIFCQRYRPESGVSTSEAWQGEMQVSLTATDVLMQAFEKRFHGDGDRAVAVVSSVYAERVGASQPAAYHVAKAGLNALVRHGAWRLGRLGVRVNAVMPLTYLKSENRDFYRNDADKMAFYRRLTPLGRMGEAQDSANVIAFLCSEKAGFVNGQSLYVDGGVSVVWPEETARSMIEDQ